MGSRGVALLQGTCVLLISFRDCQPLGLRSEWGGVRRTVRFWLVVWSLGMCLAVSWCLRGPGGCFLGGVLCPGTSCPPSPRIMEWGVPVSFPFAMVLD